MNLLPWKATACSLTLFGCLTTPGKAQNPVYRERIKPERATITILAISSTVRMLSGNQDTYIAEWSASGGTNHGLAKLVDRYRGYDDPIRRTWLESLHPLDMHLVRDEGCDAEAVTIPLSRGDTDVYDPRVRDKLKERGPDLIPCYLVEHKATRLGK